MKKKKNYLTISENSFHQISVLIASEMSPLVILMGYDFKVAEQYQLRVKPYA